MDLFLSSHKVFLPINISWVDFSVSDFALSIVGLPLIAAAALYFFTRNISYYPNQVQSFIEIIYEGLYDMFFGYVGSKGRQYIHFLISLMLFLVILNFGNLIPGFFAATSQLAVMMSLSFTIFTILLIIGFREYRFNFWKHFIPSGVPLVLKPFIFFLELLTFCVRPITLALRLTMNVIAGHMMLHIISSPTGFAMMPFSILAATAFTLFEIGVAILQAYIFVLLSSIYMSEILNSHH